MKNSTLAFSLKLNFFSNLNLVNGQVRVSGVVIIHRIILTINRNLQVFLIVKQNFIILQVLKDSNDRPPDEASKGSTITMIDDGRLFGELSPYIIQIKCKTIHHHITAISNRIKKSYDISNRKSTLMISQQRDCF